MLALADPIIIFSYEVLHTLPSSIIYVILSYIMLLSILERRVIKKYNIIFVAPVFAIIFMSMVSIKIEESTLKFLIVLIHFIIFSLVLKLYSFNQTNKGTFNLFYIVLLFYELTLILKFTIITFGFANATANFIITTFFQVAFGLFFSVFRADNPRLVFKLR